MPEESMEIQKSGIEPEQPFKPVDERGLAEKIVEAFAGMRKRVNEFREIIPQERNFGIEVQELPSGVNIQLKHKKTGRKKDLGAFLPPWHFFGKDEGFYYRGKEKKIGFPEDELRFRGFLLSLFHEIGHSHQRHEHATTKWDDLQALLGLLIKWGKFVGTAVKKELKQKGLGTEFLEMVKSLPTDTLLPHWYLDKEAYEKAKSERDAWAFALRSLRKLQGEGWDVFAGFENVAQIREYVAGCLYTYDIALFMKKLLSGDLRKMQQSTGQPAFWKKSRFYNRVVVPDTEEDEGRRV